MRKPKTQPHANRLTFCAPKQSTMQRLTIWWPPHDGPEYVDMFYEKNCHLFRRVEMKPANKLCCFGCGRDVFVSNVWTTIYLFGWYSAACGLGTCSMLERARTDEFFDSQARYYRDVGSAIMTLPQPLWEEILPELEVWRTNPKWTKQMDSTELSGATVTKSTHPEFFPPVGCDYAEVETVPTPVEHVATATTFTPIVGVGTGALLAIGTTHQTLTLQQCTEQYSSP